MTRRREGRDGPRWRRETAGRPGKRPWRRPELTELGRLLDLVRGGGGKLSAQFDGDGRKPPGSG